MSVKNFVPKLSHSQVSELVGRLFGLTAAEIRPLPSYSDQNVYVAPYEGGEYVLKVMNSKENPTIVELQTRAMNFLHQRGLPSQSAVPTHKGQIMSLEDIDCGFGTQKYLVRLLIYLPGSPIAKIPCSPQFLYEVGRMAASMDKVLQEISTEPNLSALQREKFNWSMSNVPLLEEYLLVVEDPVQQVMKNVIEQYKTKVLPKLASFRKCIIHGDLSDNNLLAEPDGASDYKVSGILDFGDMISGYYIFELAIAIMNMMIENPSPIDVGGPVLAGWESIIPLNDAERDALYLLVLCRFCQSLVLARHAVTQWPDNEEYIMTTSGRGLKHVCLLWELGKEMVERKWFQGAALHAALH